MEKQRSARQAALNKQLECGCPETNATNGDKMQCCIHNTTTTTAVSTVRNSQHKVRHIMLLDEAIKTLIRGVGNLFVYLAKLNEILQFILGSAYQK